MVFLESTLEYFLVFGGVTGIAGFWLGLLVGSRRATAHARQNAAYLLPEVAAWVEPGHATAEVKVEELAPELADLARAREMRLFVERVVGSSTVRYVVRSPQLDEGLTLFARGGAKAASLLGMSSPGFRTGDARFDQLVGVRGVRSCSWRC